MTKQIENNYLKFDANLEEFIKRYQNTRTERLFKNVITVIYNVVILTAIILCYRKLGDIVGAILLIVGCFFVSGSVTRILKESFRAPVAKKLYKLVNDKKLLSITCDEREEIATYTYEEDGIIKYAHFTIDKVVRKADIAADTLYIGKEFIYAQKWYS